MGGARGGARGGQSPRARDRGTVQGHVYPSAAPGALAGRVHPQLGFLTGGWRLAAAFQPLTYSVRGCTTGSPHEFVLFCCVRSLAGWLTRRGWGAGAERGRPGCSEYPEGRVLEPSPPDPPPRSPPESPGEKTQDPCGAKVCGCWLCGRVWRTPGGLFTHCPGGHTSWPRCPSATPGSSALRTSFPGLSFLTSARSHGDRG